MIIRVVVSGVVPLFSRNVLARSCVQYTTIVQFVLDIGHGVAFNWLGYDVLIAFSI